MFGWLKKNAPGGCVAKAPEERAGELPNHMTRVVEVVINDIDDGEKSIRWIVGEDVNRETYEQLKDEEGKLHVVTFYRNGEKEAHVTTKEHYVQARAAQTHALVAALEPNALRELACTGNVDAQWLLAGMYAAGDRVPQDDVEAAKWYCRAADQGNASAQMMVGILYFGGVGIPKNTPLAYLWLRIAERHGCQVPVELRNQVIGEMTRDKIAEADKLAQAWKRPEAAALS